VLASLEKCAVASLTHLRTCVLACHLRTTLLFVRFLATYVANINKATEGKDEKPILDLMESAIEAGPAVRNNGGGHYNHAFFWTEMAPPDEAKKTEPSEQLTKLIDKSFGSMDEMKSAFNARAAPGALFGSGWVWVCVNKKGDELKLVGTPNQDNPLMKGAADEIMFPILGLDVWEHAYYLKYQNRRPEYVENWWNLVNWYAYLSFCCCIAFFLIGPMHKDSQTYSSIFSFFAILSGIK